MKSFFALALLLLVCLFEPIMARYNLDKLMNPGLSQCLSDHSVSPDELVASAHKPIDQVSLHVKCAVKCVLKNISIVDDNGYLQLGEVLAIFNDPVLKHYLFFTLNDCQGHEGATTCESAYSTLRCIRENIWDN